MESLRVSNLRNAQYFYTYDYWRPGNPYKSNTNGYKPITSVISLLNNPIFAIESQHDAKILATDAIVTQRIAWCWWTWYALRCQTSSPASVAHTTRYSMCLIKCKSRWLCSYKQYPDGATVRWSRPPAVQESIAICYIQGWYSKVYYWNVKWWWRFQSIWQNATRR